MNVALVPALSQLAESAHSRKYGATFGLTAFSKKISGGLLGMWLAAWMVEHYGFTASLGWFGSFLALASIMPAIFSRHVRLRFEEDDTVLCAFD